MKIAMMAPWNVACGVSIHAELVGREWVKAGYELKVLAPVETEKIYIDSDEPFVVRCYSMRRSPKLTLKDLWLDPEPFLRFDYEFFVVQNLELMPIYELIKIWPQIRKKAKTILVVHEGNRSCFKEEHLSLEFDAIICFDERYRKEFSQIFTPWKIHLIPYPAHPKMLGDKAKAREELGISWEQKVVFSYGIWFQNRLAPLSVMEKLSQVYPLKYLAVIHEIPYREPIEEAKKRYSFLEVREEALSLKKLYTYLHASDVHLLWKFSEDPNLLVSSSVYLTLGSGCPIVINDSGYARDLGEEVFKFKSLDDLERVLAQVLSGKRPSPKSVETFLTQRGVDKVALSFIELFSSLN
jgi:hypothetical protein